MDKSVIMYIGVDTPPPAYLNNFEFKLVDKIKILGIEISSNPSLLHACHDKTVLKITQIIRFWERFFLSLPGRINIAKTMILSQISYLGCIIPPSRDQIVRIRNILDRFLVGKLNISKDRIYMPTNLGGLGMIDISEFIISQQVVWIKRAFLSTRDNWRVDLKHICKGNILSLGKEYVPDSRFPLLSYLAESFESFLKAFNKTNENISKSLLVNNPLLKRGRGDNRRINLNFFSGNLPRLEEQSINKIVISDVSTGGRLLSLDEISLNTGLDFNLATYLRLQECFFNSRAAFRATNNSDGSSLSVTEFFNRFKRGSRPIRKILCKFRCANIRVEDLNIVRTFERNCGVLDVDSDTKKCLLGFWSNNFLPMDLREFSFKFFNNSLGTNQRLSNFIPGRAPGCSFCTLKNHGPIPIETVVHLFFDCDSVQPIMNWFETTFLSDLNLDTREKRLKFWFFGIIHNNNLTNILFPLALSQTLLFSIWRTKLQKRLPVRMVTEMEVFFVMNKITRASAYFRAIIPNINIMLCRNWDIVRNRRG